MSMLDHENAPVVSAKNQYQPCILPHNPAVDELVVIDHLLHSIYTAC